MKKNQCRLVLHAIDNLYQRYTLSDRVIMWMDLASAVLLAICPLLQHYVAPLYNAAITSLVLIAVYLVYRMVPDFLSVTWHKISFVLPMVIYQIYRVINHGTTLAEFGQSMVLIIFMLALTLGKINIGFVIKVSRIVALVASAMLVIQYILFYLFKFHLQLVPTTLLIPAAEQWILGAQTGLAGVTGRIGNFYRPSAFFLEPAHVYLYMFPQVILLLFHDKICKKTMVTAVGISFGILLSTSGMGIAAVMGIWLLFLAIYNEKDGSYNLKNILSRKKALLLIVMLVVFLLAANYVPFLNRAVKRIFVPGKTGSTAITGRLAKSLEMVSGMTFGQWIFGVADNTHGTEFHIPGMLDALYRHGCIGFVLSYELYVKCICKLSFPYKILGAVILITSVFSAHTHSTVGSLYFLLFLFNGFQDVKCASSAVRPYTSVEYVGNDVKDKIKALINRRRKK